MLYLGNPSSQKIRDAMNAGEIGAILTPKQGNKLPAHTVWIADNGCFGKGYPGDDAWLEWLTKLVPHNDRCLFATAPDVVGDAAATLIRSAPHLPKIRALGYPAAFVAQDGLENLEVPWGDFDVLFIGGTTEWKLGFAARRLVTEAKSRGKNVHMGRVNSARRWGYAEYIGCDTVDGTFLAFGPDINLRRMRTWTRQLSLFGKAS